MAGGVAVPGDHLHRPDHAFGRRHRRAVSAGSAPRRASRCGADLLDALGMGADPRGRRLRLSRHGLRRGRGAATAPGSRSPRCRPGSPPASRPFRLRVAEIERERAAGAAEIDIVISRRHVLTGNWQALYDEMREFRAACGEAHVKAILATGELGTLRNVARASLVCMMAGADFIKTSTGKESVNATLPVTPDDGPGHPRLPRARPGYRVGYKPAGGISQGQGRAALPGADEGRAGRLRGCAPTSSASAPRRFWATSSASSSTTSPAATRPRTGTRWRDGMIEPDRHGRSSDVRAFYAMGSG